MSNREKILAAAVLCLVGAWGARYLYGRYERGQETRQSQLIAAQNERADAQLALNEGHLAVRKMEAWQQRSLPANREKALSLYKAWLLAKAKEAGLKVDDIKPAPRPTISDEFKAIGYQIEASGPLSAVVKMLHAFYSSPQLHQITRLRMMRPVGGSELQVTLEAEALLLAGATATDSLPEGESKRLQLASLAEYQKSLGDRDLASVYTPPRPPRDTTARTPPAPPKFDDAEQAYFTSTVGNRNGLQAWIHVRTTGETLKLFPGEPVNVGTLEGQIVSVERWALVWQTGDKKFRVPIGHSLRKGTELTADGKAATKAEAEQPKS